MVGLLICMGVGLLWGGGFFDLPHPTGYLIYGIGFSPWLIFGVRHVRRSLSERTTMDLIGVLMQRKMKWVSRRSDPALYWFNVVFTGGFGLLAGYSGFQMLWFGLIDLATLARLWLTGP